LPSVHFEPLNGYTPNQAYGSSEKSSTSSDRY
jgi:hypothetical protein